MNKQEYKYLIKNQNVFLDLGCGKDKKPGCLGLDIVPGDNVDIVIDIAENSLPFDDNSVDGVYSNNFFEHIPFNYKKEHKERIYEPLFWVMEEVWRVCKDKAIIEIIVPHSSGHMAPNCDHARYYNGFGLDTHEGMSFDIGMKADFKVVKTSLLLYKGLQVWNYLIEPLLNINEWTLSLYETTILKALFPARQVKFELQVKK